MNILDRTWLERLQAIGSSPESIQVRANAIENDASLARLAKVESLYEVFVYDAGNLSPNAIEAFRKTRKSVRLFCEQPRKSNKK